MSKVEENIAAENIKTEVVGTEKKKNSRLVGTLIICAVALAILGSMILYFLYYKESMATKLAAEREDAEIKAVLDVDTIYSNVYINDINVGGLTKEQAMETLVSQVSIVLDELNITYKYTGPGYSRSFTFKELGVGYDFTKAIDEAYNFGRDESQDMKQRYATVMENKDRGNYIDADWTFNQEQVAACVDLVCQDINKDPVDAKYVYSDGNITVTDSSPGIQVDKDWAVSSTMDLLPVRRSADIMLSVKTVEPKYKKEDFEFTRSEIGSYSSSFGGGNGSRQTNLRVACEKLNGKTIMPGETFSTNAALSPFTVESGYDYAGAYVNGELVEDIGGGVCQVSSALYQAALRAELEITERYNHSKKVGYMDYGYDATLAGDVKDLKITNNTGYPVLIRAYIDGSSVVIKLEGYETHSPGRTLEFFNKKVGESDGYVSYELYKNVYENGQLIDTVKINKSTYSTK